MPKILDIVTHADPRGSLSVLDHDVPFAIKRWYWIYGVDTPETVRGGHRHRHNEQLLICTSGTCRIEGQTPDTDFSFLLDRPSQGLWLESSDWHIMTEFSRDAVLLVFASAHYDQDDYIDEPYRPRIAR